MSIWESPKQNGFNGSRNRAGGQTKKVTVSERSWRTKRLGGRRGRRVQEQGARIYCIQEVRAREQQHMGCPWRRGKRCASVHMCRWMVFTHISDGAIYVLGMLCAFIKLLYIIMSSLSWVSTIYTHIHLCRCGSATYAPRGIFPATSCSLTSRPVATPCTARTRRVLSTAAKARADDAGEEWAIVMVISRRSSKPQAYRHHTPK